MNIISMYLLTILQNINAAALKAWAFLYSLPFFPADITLNPSFDPNALLKAIVNIISTACILGGVISGIVMIVQSYSEESPSRKRTGIEVIIISLLLGGGLVTFLNMVIL